MNEVVSEIEDDIPGLRRYALSLTRNSVAADDLVQDCVVRALRKCQLYRHQARRLAVHDLSQSSCERGAPQRQMEESG